MQLINTDGNESPESIASLIKCSKLASSFSSFIIQILPESILYKVTSISSVRNKIKEETEYFVFSSFLRNDLLRFSLSIKFK
ncbi:hypothetical protein D3C84_820770 [compost metagenome]